MAVLPGAHDFVINGGQFTFCHHPGHAPKSRRLLHSATPPLCIKLCNTRHKTRIKARSDQLFRFALLAQGNEFVNLWFKMWPFFNISFSLSHDYPWFRPYLEDLPSSSLQKLPEFNYRKSLLAFILMNGIGVFPGPHIAGLDGGGASRINEGSHFIQLKGDTNFDPDTFLAMIDKLERLRVIRPYHPQFVSSRATSVLHIVSRQKLSSKKPGLYKLSHGDTSVVWYWGFDTEKRYLHEFQTVNYEEAMAFYRAEKFTMWNFDKEADGR